MVETNERKDNTVAMALFGPWPGSHLFGFRLREKTGRIHVSLPKSRLEIFNGQPFHA